MAHLKLLLVSNIAWEALLPTEICFDSNRYSPFHASKKPCHFHSPVAGLICDAMSEYHFDILRPNQSSSYEAWI
jgi:hypothetical protein